MVKDELEILVHHPEIACRKIPILFFANKMDCQDALSAVKIAKGLGLEHHDRPWHISSTNALTGEGKEFIFRDGRLYWLLSILGLQDGVQWLVQQIREFISQNSDRRR